ncbi:hypothetical protein JW935_05795 [candidate division KSB1 bacterium]|nr:hypothetical protein [candidate division KSB1 bacterium]
MGITIHYGGFLKNLDSLPKLVEELTDIAESIGWEYSPLIHKLCEPFGKSQQVLLRGLPILKIL